MISSYKRISIDIKQHQLQVAVYVYLHMHVRTGGFSYACPESSIQQM